MRAALWAALGALGGPLPLVALTELAVLVADRLLPRAGALPLLALGALTLWNTPLPALPLLLLFVSLLFISLSHAFPTAVPISPLQPLALMAALVPLLRHATLAPLLFAAPLFLLVAAQRHRKGAGPADEAWLAAALLSVVLTFATRARPLRAAADAAVALGALGAVLSVAPAPPAALAALAARPLQVVAPPAVLAALYVLLSSPHSSLAPLLPLHGAPRALLALVTAAALLAATLYRRHLPARLRAPALVAACALAGFTAAHGLHGLLLGAVSAACLAFGPSRTAATRVPAAALAAALLMLQLARRAAPHLPWSAHAALAGALFLAAVSAAWLTAPRLAPRPPPLAQAPPVLLAVCHSLLDAALAPLLPAWCRLLTCALLAALSRRLAPPAACLVQAVAAANAALALLSPPPPAAAALLLPVLAAALLAPLHLRLVTRTHFAAALAAALAAAALVALLVPPPALRAAALLAVPVAAAPALWAWHHSPVYVALTPLPLAGLLLLSSRLLGPLDSLLLAASLALAAARPATAATVAGAAAGAFLLRPASLLVTLAGTACAALWASVLTGAPVALGAEAALGLVLVLVASAAPLLRPLLYLRVLAAAAAVHVAALVAPPPPAPSPAPAPLALPPSVVAVAALALAVGALRLALPWLPLSLSVSLLSPVLLLAPPLPFLHGPYALPLALTAAALVLGVLASLGGCDVLCAIAAVSAVLGAAPLAHAARLLNGTRSRSAAVWLIPLPLHVMALLFGGAEARVLAALGLAASVSLVAHGHRRNQRDLAAL